MNKATLGALAMVLVGSVTFSVSNTLFADHSGKKPEQGHTTVNNRATETSDHTSQTGKTGKVETPVTISNDVPTNNTEHQSAVNNGNSSNQTIPVPQNKTSTISTSPPTPITTTMIIKPAQNLNTASNGTGTTSTKPAGSPVAVTSNTNPVPTGTTSTATVTPPASAAQATTNHGQQISEAAKEKAPGQNKKTN